MRIFGGIYKLWSAYVNFWLCEIDHGFSEPSHVFKWYKMRETQMRNVTLRYLAELYRGQMNKKTSEQVRFNINITFQLIWNLHPAVSRFRNVEIVEMYPIRKSRQDWYQIYSNSLFRIGISLCKNFPVSWVFYNETWSFGSVRRSTTIIKKCDDCAGDSSRSLKDGVGWKGRSHEWTRCITVSGWGYGRYRLGKHIYFGWSFSSRGITGRLIPYAYRNRSD